MATKILHFLRLFGSSLFQPEVVRRHIPDFPRARFLAVRRYLKNPSMWRVSTHPLFDGAYYAAKNPDVAQAGVNPLLPYLVNGDREGRDPHPLFSARYYQATYNFKTRYVASLEHYLKQGARNGLKPDLSFDYGLYRECVDSSLSDAEILADLSSNLGEQKRRLFIER